MMRVRPKSHKETKAKIKELMKDKDTRPIAVLGAAIYFEWVFRRFVCLFGLSSVAQIREHFKNAGGGYAGYEKVFEHELNHPRVFKKGLSDNLDPDASAADVRGLLVSDVIKSGEGWAWLKYKEAPNSPVSLRNAIVHGSTNYVSESQALKAINAYFSAVEDMEKFSNVHFESLFAKLRARKKWTPNDKLKKAIALVNEKPSKLTNDPAYARRQRRWILPLVEVRQGRIDLVAYRRRKKSALDRCKLCKPYLKA